MKKTDEEIVQEFLKRITESQQDLPYEFDRIIDENFWELIKSSNEDDEPAEEKE